MSDYDPGRKHAMRDSRKNFNRIYKCLRSREVHMNRSVAPGRDICKYLRGGNVIPSGVVHHIQVGSRSSIDRKRHVATSLLKPRRFSEQEMNLVGSRRNGIAAVKDAAPPTRENLRVFGALDRVARHG